MSNIIQEAETYIKTVITDPIIQKKYLDALNDSSTYNGQIPLSPEDIEEQHKISINDQVAYKISITKDEIQEFLKSKGKFLKPGTIKYVFKSSKYSDAFKRDVSRMNNKTHLSKLVFTYAEVLHMTN